MSGSLLAAGLLLFATGLLHSGLGEVLLVRHTKLPPVPRGDAFLQRTFRLPFRVVWHLPSIFGWTFAVILIRFAGLLDLGGGERFVIKAMAVSLLLCAGVVLAGTRGRHPGSWALLASAVLCWVGASAG